MTEKPARPRSIAGDIVDVIETATRQWTKQKKSEERHPGMIRYRASRMTREPRTTQKEAAWEIMEPAYMAASGNGTLPAMARQIYYQARPKIMAMTEDKELAYGYFSQTLLPDYIEEHGVDWNVVYDARGHFIEPHTNRRIGCGTIEVGNYLHALKEPEVILRRKHRHCRPGWNQRCAVLRERGIQPAIRSGEPRQSLRPDDHLDQGRVRPCGARRLIDEICGDNNLPLFVLHDFDVAGFMIFGTLQRDTRRYQFANVVQVIDLGLRLDDIASLEREPAAATRTSADILRGQLSENGASAAEIDILLSERVELNAMTSDALIEMIERKLDDYGLEKVIPDDDVLGEAYQAFHRSQRLRKKFEEMETDFDKTATEIKVPGDLDEQVRAILDRHDELRWDDAIQIVLDGTQLDHVRAEKQKAKKKSGDFTDADEGKEEDE